MLRYVITFPPEARLPRDAIEHFRAQFEAAVTDQAKRDVVLMGGATVADLRPTNAHQLWARHQIAAKVR